ncbi:MAG: glutaredoxin domain-containing protein [Nocardioides sp.]
MSLLDRAFRRPSATHAEAVAVAHRGVWVYHRAGCPFCLRLTLGLGRRARDARWVDIWADPDAAAYVRSVNDGNETVPTVVVDGVARTNPGPSQVRAALSAGSWT